MTQSEVEKALEGMWQNLKSNYLWSFYPLSDGQRIGIVVDNNRPVGARTFWYNITVTDEDIFIDITVGGLWTKNKILFLADKKIQIINPPLDNSSDAQSAPVESIVLDKVS
ncbi:MAG: hypothetical protein ACTHK8_18900 [Ginsengibacter sp.]